MIMVIIMIMMMAILVMALIMIIDDGQAQDGFFCEELDEEDFFSLLTFSFIFQVVSINCSVSANPFNDLVFR